MAGGYYLRHGIGLVIAAISLFPAASSITDAEALLQFKSSLQNSDALSTWVAGTSPCGANTTWSGVECSNGTVSGLRLESMGLEGPLEVNALTNIGSLVTISFVNNSLTGSIPALNRIKILKEIFISKNKFYGPIPGDYFVGLVSLRSIGFADNNFTGEIPWSIGRIPELVELGLHNNLFTGKIPMIGQNSLTSFNVSNNRLSGEVPKSLWRFNLSSFSGNANLCGVNLRKPCAEAGGEILDERRKAINESIEKVITLGGVVLLSMVMLSLMFIKSEEKRTKLFDFPEKSTTRRPALTAKGTTTSDGLGSGKRNDNVKTSELVMVNDDKGVFGMADVMKAGAESLGDGGDRGFGMSYKAVMASGLTVVVKRMRDCNRVGKDGFEMEMRKLGRVKHPNLLTPLAYHYRRDEKLLISEFVPVGSLLHLLHGDPRLKMELNWAVRLIIIKGIARGLDYLHSVFPAAALPHGNLKSSNVLINSKCEPLLSEFGLDPVVNTNQVGNLLFAYKAPEAANYGIVSPKCDVFCLGIVILELLTGKFPSQYVADGSRGVDVIGWVETCISQGRVLEVFDRDLVTNTTTISRLEMEKLLYIGADCAERNPDMRLTMEEAVSRIEQIRYGGGSQDYRPQYSFESLQLGSQSTSFASFNSQSPPNLSGRMRYESHGSFDEVMIDSSYFRDIAGSSYQPEKMKLQNHVNLSGRLKQDGYATSQGTDHQSVKIKPVKVGTTHHNFYGMLAELDQ
ncbi:unnamed protein product [Rhodiola kirilowii]